MRRKLIDLVNQRANLLEQAEAALQAGNQTEYNSAMEKIGNLNGDIKQVKDLLDEQEKNFGGKLTPAEKKDIASERGNELLQGREAVAVSGHSHSIENMEAGDDAEGWDYANAPLQTGSTFKIFGLAAALEQGIPLSQQYSSAPVMTGNQQVTNVGGQSCGTCSISQALRMSLNTSFIRLQASLADGADDIEGLVAVEGRYFDGEDIGDFGEFAPEGVG